MPAIRSLILAVLLVTASVSCSGSDSGGPISPSPSPPPPPPPPPPPTSGHNVLMPTAAFEPSSLTIQRNESVTWTNTSGLLHNITFAATGAPNNIPDHISGSNIRSFPNAGTFDYRCTNHAGMNGSITVQ